MGDSEPSKSSDIKLIWVDAPPRSRAPVVFKPCRRGKITLGQCRTRSTGTHKVRLSVDKCARTCMLMCTNWPVWDDHPSSWLWPTRRHPLPAHWGFLLPDRRKGSSARRSPQPEIRSLMLSYSQYCRHTWHKCMCESRPQVRSIQQPINNIYIVLCIMALTVTYSLSWQFLWR